MAHSKFTLAAFAMTAVVIGAPAASFGAPVPSTINLFDDGHNVTVNQVRQQLRASGFTDLGTISRDGRIFELSALWEGKTVDLKVNARTRTISQIVDPRPASGDSLPSSLSLVGDPDNITVPQVVSGLQGLGFSAISNLQRSGAVFTTTASWKGQTFDLRYDASNGTITDRSAADTRPAEGFPSRIVFAGAAHEASIQDIRRALAALGYTQIGDVRQDGRIYTLSANWQGAPLDLRVDAGSRRITRR